MLDGYPLQNTVDALLKEQNPDSARDIGYLFALLNQKGDHNRQCRYSGSRYVNGDLFAKPAAVFMDKAELAQLRRSAEFDWKAVDLAPKCGLPSCRFPDSLQERPPENASFSLGSRMMSRQAT